MHLEYHLRALPSLIILKGKGKNLLVAAASRVYDPGELALLLCNLIQNGFHFRTFTFADVYSCWLEPFDLLGIIQIVISFRISDVHQSTSKMQFCREENAWWIVRWVFPDPPPALCRTWWSKKECVLKRLYLFFERVEIADLMMVSINKFLRS